MATPKDVARILQRLKFKPMHGWKTGDFDNWSRSGKEYPKPGEVWVQVYDNGKWFVTRGKVRNEGRGVSSLVKSLKTFLAQGSKTNEVLPPGRGLKDGADNGKFQPQGVAQKNEDDLEEMTGSGGVGGFGTPFAFATKEPMSSKGKKKVNEAFEALIVEFRGVTPPQYRRFLKKHGLKMVRANAEASTSTSHIVGDLWTQEPTNVNVIVSHLGKWKAGHGGDVQYGSGLANLKSRLSKYMSIRDGVNEEFNALMEGGDPYYGWRNDETQTPKQKIGRAISEINKQLREVEKVVKRTQRLKKESGTANGTLWKRTNNSLMKIESRMHRISQTIRNMRG